MRTGGGVRKEKKRERRGGKERERERWPPEATRGLPMPLRLPSLPRERISKSIEIGASAPGLFFILMLSRKVGNGIADFLVFSFFAIFQ